MHSHRSIDHNGQEKIGPWSGQNGEHPLPHRCPVKLLTFNRFGDLLRGQATIVFNVATKGDHTEPVIGLPSLE